MRYCITGSHGGDFCLKVYRRRFSGAPRGHHQCVIFVFSDQNEARNVALFFFFLLTDVPLGFNLFHFEHFVLMVYLFNYKKQRSPDLRKMGVEAPALRHIFINVLFLCRCTYLICILWNIKTFYTRLCLFEHVLSLFQEENIFNQL